MIKGSPSTLKLQITPLGRKSSAPDKKRKASTIKIPVRKGKASTTAPSTSRGDSNLVTRLEAIRERRKTIEKKLTARS